MANNKSFLTEETAGHDPLNLFARWYADAKAAIEDPSAMALATATREGEPSVRIVLLRGFDQRGFVFFTNYLSRKGEELTANPRAALSFHWAVLERQIRIEGKVAKVSDEESDEYSAARPKGNRISALVSQQSQVIPDRSSLENRFHELSELYGDGPIPRAAHWGGYRVIPHVIEFWQGRESRLHDRFRFRLQADSTWLRERLAP